MLSSDILSELRAGKLAGTTRLDLSADLTVFPPEIFDLAGSLEILNLSQNRLCDLPDDLHRLTKLRILFCSENEFTHLPAVLGRCPSLTMIGFKSNQIRHVDERSLPSSLRWLILTDNRISQLPSSIGRCRDLQKLMLAGNRLESLPDELSDCVNLELIRLSSNRLQMLPDWLFTLPRLSWLALAANPVFETQLPSPPVALIDWKDLELQEKLGEGASGVIYKANWHSNPDGHAGPVAVKIFKGVVTSDGLPASEMNHSIAVGAHPNLIQVLGRLANHPTGGLGLVMALMDQDFSNLAGPPSFASCTRDIYADGQRFPIPVALRLAMGVASAAAHLHQRGTLHGDLYGHNVLFKPCGDCLLGDFGASSIYPLDNDAIAQSLQAIEVRAFGCLLEELLDRCVIENDEMVILESLRILQLRCLSTKVWERPSFGEIRTALCKLSDVVTDPAEANCC